MIVRLLEENLYDIEEYLMSDKLYRSLDKTDSYACSQDVVNRCKEQFSNQLMPVVQEVQVCKILNGSYDIIAPANGIPHYYVVKFNNRFYDYCAKTYFSDLYDYEMKNKPVVQTVVNTLNLIHSTTSTVKGYVLIGYTPEEVFKHVEDEVEEEPETNESEDTELDTDFFNLD